MAVYQKFQSFVEKQLISGIDWDADTFKLMFTNTAPNLTTADFIDDVTDIAAGNGYVAGGPTVTVAHTRTGGTSKITGTDVVVTATGAIGPFRYVVLYKSTGTASTSPVVAMWDYGSSLTMANTDTFTVDFDATNGIFQLS